MKDGGPAARRTEGQKRRPTINDVARMAGVSKKTVSRVINESPLVRGETREAVKAIIKQTGFAPDPQARGLAFRRAFLTEVAALAGRDFTVATDTDFAALRQARLDVLGDLVAGHLDAAALERLIRGGPPPGLPVVWPAGSRATS